ncbi:hypothetical protein UFVDC4_00073 [Staphylococcus phage vB_SauM-UFV_DC4]|nr:hypothetical protein UFVDC4_00073 [Staphylococcus phage vB_SauM-UFV_DC4]
MSRIILKKNNLSEENISLKEVKRWFKKEIDFNQPSKMINDKNYVNNVNNLFDGVINIMKENKITDTMFRFISNDNNEDIRNIFIIYSIDSIPFVTRVYGPKMNLKDKNSDVNVDALLKFIKSSIIDNLMIYKFYKTTDFSFHKKLSSFGNYERNTLYDLIAEINKDAIIAAYKELSVDNLGSYLISLDNEELLNKSYDAINYFDLLMDANINVRSKEGKLIQKIDRNDIFSNRTYSEVFTFSQRSDYYFASNPLFNIPKVSDVRDDTRVDLFICTNGKEQKIRDTSVLTRENLYFNPFRQRFLSVSYEHPIRETLIYDLFLSFFGIENIENTLKRFTFELLQGVYSGIYSKGNVNEVTSKSYLLNSENKRGYTKKKKNEYPLKMNISETLSTSTHIVGYTLFNNFLFEYIQSSNKTIKLDDFNVIKLMKFITFENNNTDFNEDIKNVFTSRKDIFNGNKRINTSSHRYTNLKLGLESSLNTIFNEDKNYIDAFTNQYQNIIEGKYAFSKPEKESIIEINNEDELKEMQEEIKSKDSNIEYVEETKEETKNDKKEEKLNMSYQIIKENKFTKDVSFKYAGSTHRIDKIRKGDIELEIAKRKLFINKLINDNTKFAFVDSVEFSDSHTIKVTNIDGEVQFVSDYVDVLEGTDTLEDIRIKVTNKDLDSDENLVKLITGEETDINSLDEEILDSFMV